jgi:CarD family transcriptional regulator
MASEKLRTLTVGSLVFYPGHGVARVVATEEREFGGAMQSYYVLELAGDHGVKLMLPINNVARAGVRDLVSASKARSLMKEVVQDLSDGEDKTDPASRKLRATGHIEALRSGSADRYTSTVRGLLARFRAGKLSAGEQQTLQHALAMFVGEVSAALDRPVDDVRAELRQLTELPASGW